MPQPGTETADYAARLERLETVWWKRWLDVQRPYRWHLRSRRLGFVLDVGCGRGRNLLHLGGAGAGVGVDHNPDLVAAARARGLRVYLPSDFRASPDGQTGRFDALLFSHVLEHMTWDEGRALLAEYLPHLGPAGRVLLITPQEAGYRSDPTHVTFTDFDALDRMVRACGLHPARRYSFPFPRTVGRLFKHNEFVVEARRP